MFLDGVEADRVVLHDDQERTARLILVTRTGAPFIRVDLETVDPGASALPSVPTPSAGVLAVGRPMIEE
jgi:hypothetical protein